MMYLARLFWTLTAYRGLLAAGAELLHACRCEHHLEAFRAQRDAGILTAGGWGKGCRDDAVIISRVPLDQGR